jgi:PST family polysaccharide transporter
MRAAAYLSLRQGLGVSISFGGILLLTRAIGPESYGLYAVAMGIFYFLLSVLLWGVEVYLVRREGEEREEIYHQAFTLLLLLGFGGTLLAVSAIPLLQSWVRLEGFAPVALAVLCSLPVTLLTKVPLARLERALDYRKVATIELACLAAYYLSALPLAFAGFGVTAPIVGWWVQQSLMLILLYPAARYLPRLHWDTALVKQMIAYGLSFSASLWVWQLRDLINPLVVGRYLGPEAAAYVDLATRFVKGLSFVKEAMWRLSIAALARIQNDKPRLVRAVTEGIKLQLLAQGPLLVGFGWVAIWMLPFISGAEWRPVMEVYPFIALSYLANAVFNLHSSALYVLRRNLDVVVFHSVHVALFAGSAFLLVPRLGLVGYGLAEVVALASYAVIHACFARRVGVPSYWLAGLWWVAAAMALFVYELGWWAALGLVVAALWPQTWRELSGYARSMWKVREA